MKLLILVGTLAAGGAERQACTLAIEMKRRGVDTAVMTYAPGDFYRPLLERNGISHQFLPTSARVGYLGRILPVRKALRRNRQDVVLAMDSRPSFYAEIAGCPWRRWGLVVSERTAIPAELQKWTPLLLLHRAADYITTNSHAARLLIGRRCPSLASRTVTVYNALDLDHFSPGPVANQAKRPLQLLSFARYDPQKNLLRLIEAIRILRHRPHPVDVELDWYGRMTVPAVYSEAQASIVQNGLEEYVHLRGTAEDVVCKYRAADAVILPSTIEGLPNVICEGMACGRPILASAVSDAGNLVHEGENGFLFDPYSPAAIAAAIERFAALSCSERRDMGRRSRDLAERLFATERVGDCYQRIIEAAATRQRQAFDHWPPETPATAAAMILDRSSVAGNAVSTVPDASAQR